MDTVLWIVAGWSAWSVASLPLALVVGRALRRSDTAPRPASHGRPDPVLAA